MTNATSSPTSTASLHTDPVGLFFLILFAVFGFLLLAAAMIKRECSEDSEAPCCQWFVEYQRHQERKRLMKASCLLRVYKTKKKSQESADGEESIDPEEASEISFGSRPGCAICLETFEEGDLVCESRSTTCCHFFHWQSCMEPWLENHSECPVCREKYLLTSTAA